MNPITLELHSGDEADTFVFKTIYQNAAQVLLIMTSDFFGNCRGAWRKALSDFS